MELTFKNALFLSGCFLILIGGISLAANMVFSATDPGVLEALSRGFDTIFLALFSGVLIGVGIALLGNAVVLHTLGNRKHILLCSLSALLFLSLSAIAVFGRAGSPLFAIVSFFACITASAIFLLAALWYALSPTARKYLLTVR